MNVSSNTDINNFSFVFSLTFFVFIKMGCPLSILIGIDFWKTFWLYMTKTHPFKTWEAVFEQLLIFWNTLILISQKEQIIISRLPAGQIEVSYLFQFLLTEVITTDQVLSIVSFQISLLNWACRTEKKSKKLSILNTRLLWPNPWVF